MMMNYNPTKSPQQQPSIGLRLNNKVKGNLAIGTNNSPFTGKDLQPHVHCLTAKNGEKNPIISDEMQHTPIKQSSMSTRNRESNCDVPKESISSSA